MILSEKQKTRLNLICFIKNKLKIYKMSDSMNDLQIPEL